MRLTILGLLLVLGVAAGAVVWSTDRQQRQRAADRDAADERLEQILTAVAEIGSAQQAYVAPGQSATAAFEQTGSQVQRIYSELEAVGPSLRSGQATELLGVLTTATATLVEADSSIRGHLRSGQTLWAAEVVFGRPAHRAEMTPSASARCRRPRRVPRKASRTAGAHILVCDRPEPLRLGSGAGGPRVGFGTAAPQRAAEPDRGFHRAKTDYGPSAPTMATPSVSPPESPCRPR